MLPVVFLLVATTTVRAPSATSTGAAPQNCEGPEHRQFDFWVGEWNVKDASDGSVAGINSVTRILGGCVLLESWRGASGMEGTSFNIYDRADGAWHQI